MIYPQNYENKIGFDRIRGQVEALCVTQAAIEKLQNTTFSTSYDKIQLALEQTFEMRSILMMESDFPSKGFIDTNTSLTRIEIEGAFLETAEIVTLRRALEMVSQLTAFFASKGKEKYPHLKEMSRHIESFPEIITQIDAIIDNFGKIKDNASPELYTLRKAIRERENQVSRRLQQIMNDAQASGVVDADASISIRDGRAVIPVTAANKRKLKGFIHDESATGKTVYIEPIEIVEINNELKELEYRERREIVRILISFTDMLRPYTPQIAVSGDYLSTMDFICAKAKHAVANECTLPILSETPCLELRNARHILLEQTLRRDGKSIVPLNLKLTPDNHILLISGPNAGGKSVCLKTVGLLQYMLQCGMLIAVSESSEIGLFDNIFIDIGDEQSIDNDLSTYSSHLTNMKNILRSADNRSLILIDEFGTGTEPIIGGAIAEAVLEQLVAKGCFGVITTHYSNLKYYASNAEGIINGAMTFDVQNIKPLFKLETGRPGSSFAIEIARKIGLPESIINSASEKAGNDHIKIEKQLRDIARDRRYWEQKRDKIHQTEKRVDELADKYKDELEKIKAERAKLIKEAKNEALKITSEANRTIENTIRTIKESQAEKGKTLIVRREIEQLKETLAGDGHSDDAIERKIAQIRERQERKAEQKQNAAPVQEPAKELIIPRKIEVGVKVRIKGQEAVGEVLEINAKKAVIGFGQIRTNIELSRLETISNSEFKKVTKDNRPAAKTTNFDTMERRVQFSTQIDLRGMRASDALDATEEFIDDAIMLGFKEVKILHGKGTGALKEEIRRYLRGVDRVISAKDEHEEMGGAGITVVKINV